MQWNLSTTSFLMTRPRKRLASDKHPQDLQDCVHRSVALSGAAGPWRQYLTNLPHDCASMRCNSCQDENGTAHEMRSTRHSFKTAFIDVTSQQQWVETTGIIFLHLSSWIGNATTWKYTCLDPCMPSWPQEAEEAQQLSSLYCAWTSRQTVL